METSIIITHNKSISSALVIVVPTDDLPTINEDAPTDKDSSPTNEDLPPTKEDPPPTE